MSSGRILVIRGGAIGDFILTLPVFQALKDTFPSARVEILGYPSIAKLAELSGLVQQTKAIEAQAVAGFFARKGSLDESWSEYFNQFEIILSFLYDPDRIFQDNVGRCTKAQFIQGPHRPNEDQSTHATEVFLEPLQSLAIFEANDVPRISLPTPTTDRLPPTSRLALHPGSGSQSKNWPSENWVELVTRLQKETQWNLLIVGGEAERELLQELDNRFGSDRIKVRFATPLDELASLLADCEGFIGHDSGISHLAAAVGLPELILWGPSNESIWRPKGEKVVVIKHEDGLSKLPVEHVFARIPAPKRLA